MILWAQSCSSCPVVGTPTSCTVYGGRSMTSSPSIGHVTSGPRVTSTSTVSTWRRQCRMAAAVRCRPRWDGCVRADTGSGPTTKCLYYATTDGRPTAIHTVVKCKQNDDYLIAVVSIYLRLRIIQISNYIASFACHLANAEDLIQLLSVSGKESWIVIRNPQTSFDRHQK